MVEVEAPVVVVVDDADPATGVLDEHAAASRATITTGMSIRVLRARAVN
ncbi:MAG TPA: hypothetical protein VNC61_15220 [Acidimicrobiales bacterium]|nr:hypothetical protein [Acidimicrobiales bacterium]